MSEEREELIKALRSLATAARFRDCRVGKPDAARFEQAADLLAHQETSGWRPDREAIARTLLSRLFGGPDFGNPPDGATVLSHAAENTVEWRIELANADAILALPSSQETT